MTEAAGADQQLTQELFDSLPDGVVIADGDGVVTHANLKAGKLLGARELVGRTLREALPLQDLEGCDWYAVTAPYTGLNTRRLQAEQAWRLPDGTELLVTTRLVRRTPRDPVERVAVCLRSARWRARLDRERSDLVATVAHELRSPLTGVKGFTATLLAKWDKFGDDQKKLIMQSVHNDTDRLTRLIAELLEVARIDTGRLSMHPLLMDPVKVIRQVLESVQAGTGRPIEFAPPAELPKLFADPDKFAQVVTNLVENAVRHGEGLVTVAVTPIRATNGEGKTEYVELVVEDQGAGISPEIRKRVFTKFWKHGSRGGSGLGMYIAHGLVTAHHGEIAIGDAEGGGARIEVRWPVAADLS